jgi:heat shock protein HtpX
VLITEYVSTDNNQHPIMSYVGIQTQISRNNRNSTLLLVSFPLLLLAMVYAFLYIIGEDKSMVGYQFLKTMPFILIGVGIWFAIAYFSHSALIQMATGARPLERRENMSVSRKA